MQRKSVFYSGGFIMHRLASFVFALCGVCACVAAGSASAEEKIDVSGGWNVSIEIGGNTGTPLFVLKQDGEKLTGKYKGQFGEADITGRVKGDEIEFSFEGQGAKVVYTGTIKKNTMEGTADYAGQATGNWKGKKIDVTGTWNVEIDLNGNTGTPAFTLKQQDDKVTGRYKGQFGEADVKGKVTGDEIEFSFEAQGSEIKYKGKIDKDTMKGEADYAGQATGSWSGKRKAE
jgi:hypothetical protein